MMMNRMGLRSKVGRLYTRSLCAPSDNKLWGGRFTGAVDPLMEKYNESCAKNQAVLGKPRTFGVEVRKKKGNGIINVITPSNIKTEFKFQNTLAKSQYKGLLIDFEKVKSIIGKNSSQQP